MNRKFGTAWKQDWPLEQLKKSKKQRQSDPKKDKNEKNKLMNFLNN